LTRRPRDSGSTEFDVACPAAPDDRPLDFAMVMTLPLLSVLGYCSLP
jgi:hypothetical protein